MKLEKYIKHKDFDLLKNKAYEFSLNNSKFNDIWKIIENEFADSENEIKQMSYLDCLLYFIALIAKYLYIPSYKFNQNPDIKNMLSEYISSKIGSEINIKSKNKLFKIIDINIGNIFGIEFTLQADDGETFTREYFD